MVVSTWFDLLLPASCLLTVPEGVLLLLCELIGIGNTLIGQSVPVTAVLLGRA